jgi:hypothetical protein
MKIAKNIIVLFVVFLPEIGWSQLERLYVETYYVSDAMDATNTYGGSISEGLVTYRIYADLQPGTKVLSLFGDTDHPFIIQSSSPFYNHQDDGQSFGKEFLKARYEENLVALDTWLTIGQTTKKQANITHYGLPKHQDTDGSFIGGMNNDGGSELIPEGLLNNQNIAIPLTLSDGMDTLDFTPENWFSFGVTDFITGEDSTIFGSLSPEKTSYTSTNFVLSSSGVGGVLADSNYVLLAQLSTMGEIQLLLNLELLYLVNGTPTVMKYVGTNVINTENEIYSPQLTYPIVCGCTDPNYLEFDVTFACPDQMQCQTPIQYGCMDTLACNYDSTANFSIPALCCYPGWCADRDLESVCPSLMGQRSQMHVYPNPTSDILNVNILTGIPTTSLIVVRNAQGMVVMEEQLIGEKMNSNTALSVGELEPGIYQIMAINTLGSLQQIFIIL